MDPVAAALEKVAVRRPALIDLGLSRIVRTLDRLGAPHHRLPPVFHVAGTNGKGSTCAYIRAILEASGARVHAYTSPHLVHYRERVVLAGAEIADEAFIAAIARVDAAAGDDDLTLFETITAAAFLAFAETPADYLVMEVGLGGRLDATNVIERPLAATVTPIALDHQEFLGDTLAAVAGEKAGIFRKGAPAVIGPQTADAMAVFEREARRVDAPLFAFGSAWNAWAENGRLIYQDDDGLCDLSAPRLPGAHQFMNAALAVAAIRAAGLPFTDEILSAGLQGARWPARLQRLKSGPLVEALGPRSELWLDGGHNPHAARALAAALADMEERNSRPLILIAGMQQNKDIDGFFAAFSGLASTVFAVQAGHSGSRTPDDVAAAAERAGIPAYPCGSLLEAASLAHGGGAARVLICGSLYLAGDVLRDNA